MLDILNKVWHKQKFKVYFLDICIVSDIKQINAGKISNKLEEVKKRLKHIDLKNNRISLALILFEKSSDRKATMTTLELSQQFGHDLKELSKFFKKAKICESEKLLCDAVQKLCYQNIEFLGDNYLKFLETMNQLGLKDPIAFEKRFAKATEVIKIANDFGIAKQSPVLLLVLASIYETKFAKKIIKWKKEQINFDASNALADIMSIYLMASLTPKLPKTVVSSSFITSDENLQKFYEAVQVKNLGFNYDENLLLECHYKVNIIGHKLFPDLFNANGTEFRSKSREKIYNELVEVLELNL